MSLRVAIPTNWRQCLTLVRWPLYQYLSWSCLLGNNIFVASVLWCMYVLIYVGAPMQGLWRDFTPKLQTYIMSLVKFVSSCSSISQAFLNAFCCPDLSFSGLPFKKTWWNKDIFTRVIVKTQWYLTLILYTLVGRHDFSSLTCHLFFLLQISLSIFCNDW